MPNELFNGNQADPQGAAKPEPTDQPSLFHVGEGKKYQSIEDLDKAYGHANEHISKLEQELQELREKNSQVEEDKGALDKILEAVQASKQQDQADNASEPAQVEEVVRQLLEQEKAKSVAQTNAEKVRQALEAKYGEKAGEMYVKRGKELGIDLDELTARSADAVLAMFGASAEAPRNVPPSSVDTSTFAPKPTEDPNRKLYEEKKISREELFRRQWREAMKNQ